MNSAIKKRGSPERQTVNMPQEVDKGRRRLLAGAATLVGAGVVIGALSRAEPAYAAVKKIADFKDRRNRTSLTHSAPNDTPVTLNLSQGQPVNVQDTPTPDATVTALQKRLLQDQAHQLETPPPSWLASNIATLIGFAGTAATIGVGIWQFNKTVHNDRENQAQQQTRDEANRLAQHARDEANRLAQEQERLNGLRIENERRREDQLIEQGKQDEARFQEAVLALGKDETKLAAATTLRTFLQEEGKGYERFYKQIFDLTGGFLQNRVVDPNNPKPDAFNKAIIKLFIESFPLARKLAKDKFEKEGKMYDRSYLDASDVKLDGADLNVLGVDIDLSEAWMPNASFNDAKLGGANLIRADLSGAFLNEADLNNAKLGGADLSRADLSEADLNRANLSGAFLNEADLSRANLREAWLSGAWLYNAHLSEAFLNWADLSEAKLGGANLSGAFLSNANLTGANLNVANLTGAYLSEADLTGANPEDASALQSTNMWNVKNYDDLEKRQICKDKGADFDTSPFDTPPDQPKTKGETK